MSLLGIDVGTTGCKGVAFSVEGKVLSSSYEEYDIVSPSHGIAELDSRDVWGKVQAVIRQIVTQTTGDPVTAVCASSMGEAVVPVSKDRKILANSIMNFDSRGGEYLDKLPVFSDDEQLYGINGNTLTNSMGLTKLLWIRDNRKDLYDKTYKFLNWGAFVSFMLGSEPIIDYALANRSLLFDLDTCTWSDFLLQEAGFDREKLPETVQSGTVIGSVSAGSAQKTGLAQGTPIVAGVHDQFSNALGCGVIREGEAMYGYGTFTCIVPVFKGKKDPAVMIRQGLNTEHHAVKGLFGSFIYNPGGAIVKWYRDTFAAAEHKTAQENGYDVYPSLFAEMPEGPSKVISLPHFSTMGPPGFIEDSCGAVAGLYLGTKRGEVLKGLIEGATFSLKESVDMLPDAGISIEKFIPAGGGSKSREWIQLAADIIGIPFHKPNVTEAGSLGVAILAGMGTGQYASAEEGIQATVKIEEQFEPDMNNHKRYLPRYEKFKQFWPLFGDYLRGL